MIGRFYVTITEIEEMDEDYIYRDKNDGEYLIGNYVILNDSEKEIVGSIISNKAFFSFEYSHVNTYLITGTRMYKSKYRSDTHIIQIFLDNSNNSNNTEFRIFLEPVIKTYWIRLIQRHWKKVFRIKKEIIKNQMMLYSLKMREIKGKTLFKNIPGIKGMLSIYTENKWNVSVSSSIYYGANA
jgi:hypothetical protein